MAAAETISRWRTLYGSPSAGRALAGVGVTADEGGRRRAGGEDAVLLERLGLERLAVGKRVAERSHQPISSRAGSSGSTATETGRPGRRLCNTCRDSTWRTLAS